jgi:translation initiation factor IF-2
MKMRSHGARVADLAILVVAADEGVKPQTQEALGHILEAKIPYVVAINKVDKPSADIEKTKVGLMQNGVYLEGFGGNISWQAISAKTGQGIKELLDIILLAAAVENLEYDPAAPASGVVIRSERDARKGIIVDVILKNGILKRRQEVFTGTAKGRVKFLGDFLGRAVAKIEPSSPARILGFETMPEVGEEFSSVRDSITLKKPVTESGSHQKERQEETSATKVILKAKELGSLYALKQLIQNLKSGAITVLASGVGDIYESDVKLALTAGAILVGFNVQVDRAATNLAGAHNIKIITAEVIYDLEKELREYLDKKAAESKRFIEILATFGEKDKRQIVGGRVLGGVIKNQEKFKILRKEETLGEGKIVNLQSQKKDVMEVQAGNEAGLLVEVSLKIMPGDRLLFE